MNDDRSFWRALRTGLFAAAALGLLWLVARTSNSIAGVRYCVLPDDAMISMRFARNLADGVGLVWNAGDRVQGYSNPAWTLLMAAVHRLPIPDRLTSLPMQLASVGFHLLTALAIWRTVVRRIGDEWAMAATGAYLASSCATLWAISGWEVSAVTFGWTLALAPVIDPQFTRRAMWTSLFAAGVAATLRPDATLVFIVAAAFHLGVALVRRRGLVDVVAAVAVGAILPAALAIWQREYYGNWVPNTVMLKRSPGAMAIVPGLSYLATSLIRYPLNLVAIAGAFAYASRLQRATRLALTWLVAIYVVHIVSAGGDAFGHARFLLPLLPTATILAAFRFAAIPVTRPAIARTLAIAVTFLVSIDFSDAAIRQVQRQKDSNRRSLLTSLALQKLAEGRHPVVGVLAAGTVPYFNPHLQFHDMLGKNDERIARTPPHSGVAGHDHWDFDYSLNDVRPDLVITTYPLDARQPSLELSGFRRISDYYQDLYDHAAFARHYLRTRVPIEFAGERVTIFEAYARDDGAFSRDRTR